MNLSLILLHKYIKSVKQKEIYFTLILKEKVILYFNK